MTSSRALAVLCCLALFALAPAASAAPITVMTSGVVVGSPLDGSVDPNFTLGERIDITYTVESTASPTTPGTYPTALVSLTIDFVDSMRSYSYTGGPVTVTNDLLGIDALSMSGATVVSATPIGGIVPDTNQLELIDSTGTMFNSTALPTGPIAYDSGRIVLGESSGSLMVEIFFVPVPEPATLSLLALALLGARVRRGRAG